ncbi:hypothetical protein Tco_0420794 [Tanacetum coccineum]
MVRPSTPPCVVSSGWSFVSAVPGQMTYPVASLTLDSASPEGFLPSIQLMVFMVTVVIVAVILVVIVVVIFGVVVVVGGVSSIIKLSFMIISFLRIIVFYYLLHQPLGYGNGFLHSLRLRSSNISFNTSGFGGVTEKVKQHYQELFNFIKITLVKTIERTTSLQTKIENLKTQLKGKMPCITSNVESPNAIEVESIPPSQRNNRDVHHHYLNRLRDTLDTLRKIVEEARSKRLSDYSLDYACV